LPPDAPTAFFSYSREDSEFALRLAEDLKAAGAAVWLDQLDIAPGERWARAVQEALQNCPRVLVILSPASVGSNHVEDEVNFALDEQKAVIPVFYQDCKVPFRLRPLQYVDFRTDYAHALRIMLKTLGVAQQSAGGPAAAPASPRASPPIAAHAEEGRKASEQPEERKRVAKRARPLLAVVGAAAVAAVGVLTWRIISPTVLAPARPAPLAPGESGPRADPTKQAMSEAALLAEARTGVLVTNCDAVRGIGFNPQSSTGSVLIPHSRQDPFDLTDGGNIEFSHGGRIWGYGCQKFGLVKALNITDKTKAKDRVTVAYCQNPVPLYYGSQHRKYGYVLMPAGSNAADTPWIEACTRISMHEVLGESSGCSKSATAISCKGERGVSIWEGVMVPTPTGIAGDPYGLLCDESAHLEKVCIADQ
jgi:hypothetical protein